MPIKTFSGRLILGLLIAVCYFGSQPLNIQSHAAAGEILASLPGSTSSPNNVAPEGLFKNIEGLRLYEIVDGRKRNTYFSRRDLESGMPLSSSGYVSGVVLISESPDMAAKIDDRLLERQVDGSRFAKVIADQGMHVEEGLIAGRHYYAYFPVISGDAVSPDNQFCLSIDDGHTRQALTIHQKGYQCIPHAQGAAPVFRYAGADLDHFLTGLGDLEARMEVIASGIRRVEQTFGLELVDFVNILPYTGPVNALTLKDRSQIWFYADTFRTQPLSELRGMAQHETLHILVDRLGYTRRTALRELFADLLGYGLFSMERFSIVTTGAAPRGALRSQLSENLFFAFINEKNFIPGMTGGHSADTLDEFTTSFLHSLLYIEHLDHNIRKPEVLTADGGRRRITEAERRSLLRDYQRTLAIFMGMAGRPTDSFLVDSRDFLERCMTVVAHARLEPPDEAALN
jgi:hypothetical protein